MCVCYIFYIIKVKHENGDINKVFYTETYISKMYFNLKFRFFLMCDFFYSISVLSVSPLYIQYLVCIR